MRGTTWQEKRQMTQEKMKLSPKILSVKWGKMEVETLGLGKDFRLWPGGGSNWDWHKSGTRHSPGIQIRDCDILLENNSRIVVLSRGMFLRLKIPRQTTDYLKSKGVETVVAETKKAVKIYNSLVERGEAVGGLFHSTC